MLKAATYKASSEHADCAAKDRQRCAAASHLEVLDSEKLSTSECPSGLSPADQRSLAVSARNRAVCGFRPLDRRDGRSPLSLIPWEPQEPWHLVEYLRLVRCSQARVELVLAQLP
jgi:hypothetical protein